jgi:hypothetical protein
VSLFFLNAAFYGEVPMSATVERSLFWAFAAIVLRLPPVRFFFHACIARVFVDRCGILLLFQALMADRLAVMCRFLSPETIDWNYNMVLWRSSQLYSCSFAYTLLSVLSGKLFFL